LLSRPSGSPRLEVRRGVGVTELLTGPCLTLPEQIFARPGMVDKMVKLAEANPPQPMPGPTREELLKLIAAPTGA